MLYCLSELILFLYQIFKKNNSFIGFIGLIILGYFAGSPNPLYTYDYSMYWYQYNQTGLTGNFYFEKWYSELGLFFYKLGASYEEFRIFFALLATVILYIGVRRFTKNVALFAAIYGITVFVTDATQIRSYMMISIIIYAMSFLKELNLKNYMIFITLTIIAAQFQSSAYIFLLLLPIRIWVNKGNHFWKIIIITIGCFFGFLIVGKSKIIQVLAWLASFSNGRVNLIEKVSGQYNYGTSILRFIIIVGSTIMGLILAKYIYQQVNNSEAKCLYSGLAFSVLTLPLLYIAADYQRLQRGSFLFLIIMISIFFEKKRFSFSKEQLFFIILGMIGVCYITTISNVSGSFANSVPYILKIK